MREGENGTVFPSERKKVSVKASRKEENIEGKSRSGGYGAGYGVERLRGGSTMQNNLPVHSAVKRAVKKRKEGEESLLPQWGNGKRSRGSRLEPPRPLSPSPSSEAKPLDTVSRQCSSFKLAINKSIGKDRIIPRTGLARTGKNCSVGSLRQAVLEGNERIAQTEGASLQQNEGVANHGSWRQEQGSGGPSFAMRIEGQSDCNGNTSRCNVNGNDSCAPLLEPAALACSFKSRVDVQMLEWPRFVISLTRKEKEDDFLVLKGSKLPQRPKKRLRVVEKALLYCTPGNWLSDLVQGRYDVREKKNVKRKARGLKSMESLESESD